MWKEKNKNKNIKAMTSKQVILEKYPKAQCVAESDSENSKNKNKKFIVCRKINENQIEKMSIGEKYYSTPIDAWDAALIYVNNNDRIERLLKENNQIRNDAADFCLYSYELETENEKLVDDYNRIRYKYSHANNLICIGGCAAVALLAFAFINKLIRY